MQKIWGYGIEPIPGIKHSYSSTLDGKIQMKMLLKLLQSLLSMELLPAYFLVEILQNNQFFSTKNGDALA